jgi:SAM-dependent methyltransferase
MPTWFLIFLLTAGIVFGLKILYIATTAAALPVTQGALYVSTARARIHTFLDAVRMTPEQNLVDLGCGDGRVLRYANKRYGVRAVGYEINLLAYLKARCLCLFKPGIRIALKNFWQADISEADVIFCYLYPDVLKRLALKLSQELKPGAVVVCGNFSLPGWSPSEVLRCARPVYNSPLYIYRNTRPNARQTAKDLR